MASVISPRPPLNLFEVVRSEFTSEWSTLYDVPNYIIPASGPNPEQTIQTAAIMTGLMLANTTGGLASASVRIAKGAGETLETFDVTENIPVFEGDITIVPFDRQIMRDGERLEIRSNGATLTAHLTFILNQREQFEVIV